MVAVIKGAVVGGLGPFTPQIPPPPPHIQPPTPSKGEDQYHGVSKHLTKNIIATASYPYVSLSRRFADNNHKNMK